MSDWRGARYLAMDELKRIRWRHLLSLLLIGYLLLFVAPMLEDLISGKTGWGVNWVVDYIMITLLPCVGLTSVQGGSFTWGADVMTKKLVAWRILPIPVRQIALGRLLALIIIAIPAYSLFFALFYWSLRSMGLEYTIGQYIDFALFWTGYAIAACIVYLYFEMGFNSFRYFMFCTFIIIVCLIGVLIHSVVFEESFVLASFQASVSGDWWLALSGIAAAGAALLIGSRILGNVVKSRSYFN